MHEDKTEIRLRPSWRGLRESFSRMLLSPLLIILASCSGIKLLGMRYPGLEVPPGLTWTLILVVMPAMFVVPSGGLFLYQLLRRMEWRLADGRMTLMAGRRQVVTFHRDEITNVLDLKAVRAIHLVIDGKLKDYRFCFLKAEELAELDEFLADRVQPGRAPERLNVWSILRMIVVLPVSFYLVGMTGLGGCLHLPLLIRKAGVGPTDRLWEWLVNTQGVVRAGLWFQFLFVMVFCAAMVSWTNGPATKPPARSSGFWSGFRNTSLNVSRVYLVVMSVLGGCVTLPMLMMKADSGWKQSLWQSLVSGHGTVKASALLHGGLALVYVGACLLAVWLKRWARAEHGMVPEGRRMSS